MLSTRAWLLGLENAGVIASAADVIARIGRHGPVRSAVQVDKPAGQDDRSTDWLTAVIGGANPDADLA